MYYLAFSDMIEEIQLEAARTATVQNVQIVYYSQSFNTKILE